MVELDEGILQSEKAQLLHLEPPTGKTKRWMQRDLSQALERLKVREQSNLNYEDYLALKTNVVLLGIDITTGEQKGAGQGGLGFIFSLFMLTFVFYQFRACMFRRNRKNPCKTAEQRGKGI